MREIQQFRNNSNATASAFRSSERRPMGDIYLSDSHNQQKSTQDPLLLAQYDELVFKLKSLEPKIEKFNKVKVKKQTLEGQVKLLKSEKSDLEVKLKVTEKQLSELDSEFRHLTSRYPDALKYQELEREKDGLKKDLEKEKDMNKHVERDCEELRNLLRASNTKIQLFQREIPEIRQQLQDATAEKDELLDIVKQTEELGRTIAELEKERDILLKSISEAKGELEQVTLQREQLSNDLVNVFNTLEGLEWALDRV